MSKSPHNWIRSFLVGTLNKEIPCWACNPLLKAYVITSPCWACPPCTRTRRFRVRTLRETLSAKFPVNASTMCNTCLSLCARVTSSNREHASHGISDDNLSSRDLNKEKLPQQRLSLKSPTRKLVSTATRLFPVSRRCQGRIKEIPCWAWYV